MRVLSLVRHAKSDRRVDVPDRERPLSARGEHAAPAMARRWIGLGLVPDRILTSPAVRAHQTALLFAGEFGLAPASIELDERLYLASPGELLEAIHDTPARTRHLMVFGHNPGISALARMLYPDLPFAELPTAAACTVTSSARSWSRVEDGTILLVACEQP